MRCKTAAISGLLVISVLCFGLALEKKHLKSSINQCQYEKIELGMTKEEVIEILGCPPGDYSKGRVMAFSPFVSHLGCFEYSEWVGIETGIEVAFSEGKVVRKGLMSVMPTSDFDMFMIQILSAFQHSLEKVAH